VANLERSDGQPEGVDGRTKRANEQRESRRAAILKGALRVFGRKGYHQTHVADIIKAAGIARGTFYLYFEGKSAIFLELLDQMLEQFRESIVGVDTHEGAPPVELQLIGTVRRIMDTVVQNRLLTTIIIREAVGLDQEVDRRLKLFYDDLLRYIRDALGEGQRLGYIRKLDEDVAAMCILGTIKQFMEMLVMMGDEESVDVDRMALSVLDFNLRGVLGV
jgi:AcrR family transcriptional regulator